MMYTYLLTPFLNLPLHILPHPRNIPRKLPLSKVKLANDTGICAVSCGAVDVGREGGEMELRSPCTVSRALGGGKVWFKDNDVLIWDGFLGGLGGGEANLRDEYPGRARGDGGGFGGVRHSGEAE